jgi:hypothetical protein
VAKENDAATKPAVVRNHVYQGERPYDDSVLENTQQPANQNEIHSPQEVTQPLPCKHPTGMPGKRTLWNDFRQAFRKLHDAKPRMTDPY